MEGVLCEDPVDQTNDEAGVEDSQAPTSPHIGCGQKGTGVKEQVRLFHILTVYFAILLVLCGKLLLICAVLILFLQIRQV